MSLLGADPSGGMAGERDRLNLPCLGSLACRQQGDLGARAVEVCPQGGGTWAGPVFSSSI